MPSCTRGWSPCPPTGSRVLPPHTLPFTRHSRVDSGPESWPPPVHSLSWPLRQGYRSPPALHSESRHADSPPLHPERIRGEVTRIYDFTKKPGRDAHVLGDPNSQGLPRTPNMRQKKRGCPPRSLFFRSRKRRCVCQHTPFPPFIPAKPCQQPLGQAHPRRPRASVGGRVGVAPQ